MTADRQAGIQSVHHGDVDGSVSGSEPNVELSVRERGRLFVLVCLIVLPWAIGLPIVAIVLRPSAWPLFVAMVVVFVVGGAWRSYACTSS